jgi:hypothetical protein
MKVGGSPGKAVALLVRAYQHQEKHVNRSMTPRLLSSQNTNLSSQTDLIRQLSRGASSWRDSTKRAVKRQVTLCGDGPALEVGQGAAAEDRRALSLNPPKIRE